MNAPASNTASHAGKSAPGRPPELEDWLNRVVFHPLSKRLARALARTPVTPNMVSALGGLAVALAAVSYGFLSYPAGVLVGFALHLSWHVLDGADGDLARMTGRVSPMGEFVDGLFDYLGHIAMYLVLATLVAPLAGWWTLPLIVAAALGRAAQQNFFETVRRSYEYWVYGRAWLGVTRPVESTPEPTTTAQRLVHNYLRGAGSMLPEVAVLNRLYHEGGQEWLGKAVKAQQQGLLAWLAPFGSNQRTLALGLAMSVQMPVLYLLYEAVLLNLALAWMIRRKRRLLAALVATQPSSTER